MERYRYIVLLLFITVCASFYASMAVFLAFGTWISVFLASAVGILLFLENLQLVKELQQKETRILFMRECAAKTLQFETDKLKIEILALKAKHILTRSFSRSF